MTRAIYLPSPDDFEASTKAVTEHIKQDGNAWASITSREMDMAKLNDMNYRKRIYSALGQIGARLEPRDERGLAIDPTLRLGHAIKRGLMLGSRIVRITKGFDTQDVENAVLAMYTSYEHCPVAMRRIGQEVSENPILSDGQRGIMRMGIPARREAYAWTRELVLDKNAHYRPIVMLGIGAMVQSAYETREQIIFEAIRQELNAKTGE